MPNITMYDSAENSQFPEGGAAYAGYVDGHVLSQPNYGWVVQNFPDAHHLSISVLGNDADCLDIESGAATVAMAAGWYRAQKARGIARPVFYASASMMESDLIPAIRAAGIARTEYRLWSAHYGNGAHICGPGTCRLLSIAADGTQWTDAVGSLNADESLLTPDFFGGSDPVSEPVLSQGATGAAVVLLQQRLDIWGAKLAVDGDFGPQTLAAVKAFQVSRHLAADGIAGPQTWVALMTDPSGIPAPSGLSVSYVSADLHWSPVIIDGKTASTYVVEVIQLNGTARASTVATNSTVLQNLVYGWVYNIRVHAPGGATAATVITA